MDNLPEFIGSYRILKTLGLGGMGVVYQARHEETDDNVALKTVRLAHEGLLQSLRREIRGLARIRHPGIVRIVDEGVHEGLPWYAMELLEGATLRHHFTAASPRPTTARKNQGTSACATASIEEEPTPNIRWTDSSLRDTAPRGSSDPAPECGPRNERSDVGVHLFRPRINIDPIENLSRILTLVYRLCIPLAFLHGEGVVHRDLKPDNVFVKSDGNPVLVDFGLMAQFGGVISRESLVVERGGIGTVSYMAPEQIRGGFVDARADIYALGCILFELLVGHPPFIAPIPTQILRAHLHAAPVSPSKLRPGLPEELDDLVLKLLTKDPRTRPGYADTVASELVHLGADPGQEVRGPKARPYLYRSGFVGRVKQLDLLGEHLDQLGQGKGGLILLGGESGVGKTRLAVEFGQVADDLGVQVLTGECLEQRLRPLLIFRKIFQFLSDLCREKGPDETDRLLGPRIKLFMLYEPCFMDLPQVDTYPDISDLPANSARLRLFSYLIETLEALGEDKPLLLIFDDLQWADDLSSGFLNFVLQAGHLTRLPILILGTFRSEEVTPDIQNMMNNPETKCIDLNRLDEQAINSIVADMLALSSTPEVFCRYMSRHSEGNPFFIAEYLRASVERGLLWRDEYGKWQVAAPSHHTATTSDFEQLPLPRALHDLIKHRLTGLPQSAKTVARSCSVLGREASTALLWEMSKLEEAEFFDATKELLRCFILERTEPDSLRFTHDKIREVTYKNIACDERPQLHRDAAQAIEALFAETRIEHLAELGQHWAAAGELNKARDCYLAGARRAKDRYSLTEAEHLYRAYLALVEKPAVEVVSAYIELGENVLHVQGRHREALVEHQQALELAEKTGDRFEIARSTVCLGKDNLRLGHLDKTQKLYNEALEIFRELGNRYYEGKTLGNLASLNFEQSRFEQARNLHEQALTLIRESGDQMHEGVTLGNLANIHFATGDLEKASELYHQALSIFRTIGDQRLEGWIIDHIAQLHQDQGREKEAYELFKQALALHRKAGYRRNEGITLGKMASHMDRMGFTQKSRELYKQALNVFQDIGDRLFQGWTLGNLAYHYQNHGLLEKAWPLLEQSLKLAQDLRNKQLEAFIHANIGTHYREQGSLEEAKKSYNSSLAMYRELGDRRMIGSALFNMANLVRLTTGNFEEVEKMLKKSESLLRGVKDPVSLIANLGEQGMNALAQGQSAKSYLKEIDKLAAHVDLPAESRLKSSITSLRNAQKSFEAGNQKLLFRGELIEDIPQNIRQWLAREGQLPLEQISAE
ncbi:tetratricopeptide repeat protein [candidate division CSSED10-310 bacterium]|uniref:Tetratricopeptide repeat protein n=1 Tax=candidate division CSSED10-310 bacterium TaxID=2855610 RepID=A0ABV6Z1I6_UNCC1